MISKLPRHNEEGRFNVKMTDKNKHSFTMMVGGNGDLYWVPENHKQNRIFEIDSMDEMTYGLFNQLFEAVRKRDDKYNPVLKDNVITFISEDWHEDEANTLKIIQSQDSFTIEFIKNENKDAWSLPHLGCNICFCNSGSRVPRVEQLFMLMFNYLAYQCDLIPIEQENEKSL